MHMAVSDASTGEEEAAGFDFAFDNKAFSDRVLRIEILGSSEVAPSSAADGPSRKRLREEGEGEDGKGCTLAGTPILQVKTMHVSSAILAAKSSFFFKMGPFTVPRFRREGQDFKLTFASTSATSSSINAIQIDRPSCVINFTVKREQCARLFPVGEMRSPPFHCAGHGFLLKAQCITEKNEIFALLVEMLEDKGPLWTVHYKLEAKARPSLEFVTLKSLTTTTDSTQAVGCRCLWSQFFTGKNALFIDDMLHLRVQVKITPKP